MTVSRLFSSTWSKAQWRRPSLPERTSMLLVLPLFARPARQWCAADASNFPVSLVCLLPAKQSQAKFLMEIPRQQSFLETCPTTQPNCSAVIKAPFADLPQLLGRTPISDFCAYGRPY